MISKATPISIGLMITAIGIAYKAGSKDEKSVSLIPRVEALEQHVQIDQSFREEVLQRLARIETAVKKEGK